MAMHASFEEVTPASLDYTFVWSRWEVKEEERRWQRECTSVGATIRYIVVERMPSWETPTGKAAAAAISARVAVVAATIAREAAAVPVDSRRTTATTTTMRTTPSCTAASTTLRRLFIF
jgi:hypothetical protein